jgi:hypothetical protein
LKINELLSKNNPKIAQVNCFVCIFDYQTNKYFMRRNFHTYGMNYQQREAYRLGRKKVIADGKANKAATITRLMDIW